MDNGFTEQGGGSRTVWITFLDSDPGSDIVFDNFFSSRHMQKIHNTTTILWPCFFKERKVRRTFPLKAIFIYAAKTFIADLAGSSLCSLQIRVWRICKKGEKNQSCMQRDSVCKPCKFLLSGFAHPRLRCRMGFYFFLPLTVITYILNAH